MPACIRNKPSSDANIKYRKKPCQSWRGFLFGVERAVGPVGAKPYLLKSGVP